VFLGAASGHGQEKIAALPQDGGSVRLPLPEYERLLTAARKAQERPPVEAGFASTQFQLSADGSPRLSSTLEIFSLSETTQFLSLPDLGTIASSEITGEGATLVAGDSGELRIRVERRGRFVVRLESVPARQERSGSVQITWTVPDSPSNRLTATLPTGYADVTLSGGTATVSADRAGPVRVAATLLRGQTARLAYAVAATRAPEEKLLAQAAESRLYRIGEKTLGLASRLRIEVLRGTLRRFAVDAPADFRVVSVWAAGNTVTSFESDPSSPGRLILTLERGVESGATEIFFLLERQERIESGELRLPEIELPDFLRGETAVAVESPRPLLLDEAKGRREGYERIDESDLPTELKELAESTVLLSLRRVGSAKPDLSVSLSSFPDATGLAGVIDSAKVLTISTREGRRVDRWVLDLQSRESILRVPLPENAAIWTLEVDGKTVKPLTEQGQLLVPLGRGEKSLRPRRVEIVLATPSGASPARGAAHLELAKLPYPITRLEWELFLPEDFRYRFARGNVEPLAPEIERRAVATVEGGVPGGVVGGMAAESLDSLNTKAAGGDLERGEGRLMGQVLDQTKGALQGVTVTLRDARSGRSRTTVTDAQGSYRFMEIPAGEFRLRADLAGFASSERPITLPPSANVGADLQLKLSAKEAVTVSAEAPRIDLSMSYSGSAIQEDVLASRRRPPAQRPAAPEPARDVLSLGERAALQRTTEAGVNAIPIELPQTGKRLRFEGRLFLTEVPSIELQVRPARKGWLLW
jgi:hypothetical protein